MASNHHALRIGPPDSQHECFLEPIPAQLMRAIEMSIKKHLLVVHDQEKGVELTATGLRPIRLVTRYFGSTALVAGVIRNENKLVESLTICRAGLDNADDEAALTAVSELILQDAAEEFVSALIEQVSDQPTPSAVHVHLDEDNYQDSSVRVVTRCVAESFFDQFGIEKTHTVTDM